MKTLKQIKEEFNFTSIPEVISLEEAKASELSQQTAPPLSVMPQLLLFRRITYKLYPNKQIVALYYSKMVDKYLSVPFGPTGNLNMSEAVVHDSLDELNEDWQKVNRQDKTDGLSQKAVNAYRRENPGSKLKTAVTEKNPTGKRASRRKSFCSRMGGMKKRLTSAKTARDPDSRINKALRRWNCEESFRQKLNEKRMQQDEGVADVLDAGAEALVPYYSAGKKLYKGDYKGAAIDAAADTAVMAAGAGIGKLALGAAKAGGKALGKIAGRFAKTKAPTAPKTASRKAVPTAPKSTAPKAPVKTSPFKNLLNKDTSSGSSSQEAQPADVSFIKQKESGKYRKTTGQPTPDPVTQSRLKTQALKENKISDLRKMIDENLESTTLKINGRSVTLNNTMAKRIIEVYDSVNTKNKKIVESMLNENLESFKKLLNFSIKA